MRLFGMLFFLVISAVACTGTPKGVTAVDNFVLNRYLGNWYEIARLDHGFERGLSNVTAQYSLKGDGGVKVINRGYSAEEKEWKQAEGKAYFVDGPHKGHLKVSFFGPFYGSYVIFELDDDYRYAFVSGPNHDYLWLLSRTPTVSDEVKQRFINKAKVAGFDTEELLFVEQKTLN